MTTDIARLVEELRARASTAPTKFHWAAESLTRAASALEAQARELAEAWEIANAQGQQRMANLLRAEAAEARLTALEDALEPFADFGEFMEVETEGFSDTDRLNLMPEESDVVIGDLFVAAFRRARSALNGEPRT